MRSIVTTALILCLALWGSTTRAESFMPSVPEGLTKLSTVYCTDAASGEYGQCVIERDAAGLNYIVFKQDGVIQFIRQTFPDAPYVDLWVRDTFATY